MSKKSENFEQQIVRIKKVLEKKDAVIKWNDKISDPDNTSQLRQIDISIAKQGFITHVECRIHKCPQSVKWIEELIGRKISLSVDSMIGVSSSGFTKGAIRKAKSHGIILRQLNEITELEVDSWGNKFNIGVTYLVLKDIKINIIHNSNTLTDKIILDWIQVNSDFLYSMIKYLSDNYPKTHNQLDLTNRDIKLEFKIPNELNNPGIIKGILEAKGELLSVNEEVVSFFSYNNPIENNNDCKAIIEKNKIESIEVINTQMTTTVNLDMSKINCPENGLFQCIFLNAKKESTLNFNILSFPKEHIELSNVIIKISKK